MLENQQYRAITIDSKLTDFALRQLPAIHSCNATVFQYDTKEDIIPSYHPKIALTVKAKPSQHLVPDKMVEPGCFFYFIAAVTDHKDAITRCGYIDIAILCFRQIGDSRLYILWERNIVETVSSNIIARQILVSTHPKSAFAVAQHVANLIVANAVNIVAMMLEE